MVNLHTLLNESMDSTDEFSLSTKGKGKGKKGQRLNEITDSPEEQWTGGPWEQRLEQSWNTEADTGSWRDDDWNTAVSNS